MGLFSDRKNSEANISLGHNRFFFLSVTATRNDSVKSAAATDRYDMQLIEEEIRTCLDR
jgi:hypothetical protein